MLLVNISLKWEKEDWGPDNGKKREAGQLGNITIGTPHHGPQEGGSMGPSGSDIRLLNFAGEKKGTQASAE